MQLKDMHCKEQLGTDWNRSNQKFLTGGGKREAEKYGLLQWEMKTSSSCLIEYNNLQLGELQHSWIVSKDTVYRFPAYMHIYIYSCWVYVYLYAHQLEVTWESINITVRWLLVLWVKTLGCPRTAHKAERMQFSRASPEPQGAGSHQSGKARHSQTGTQISLGLKDCTAKDHRYSGKTHQDPPSCPYTTINSLSTLNWSSTSS